MSGIFGIFPLNPKTINHFTITQLRKWSEMYGTTPAEIYSNDSFVMGCSYDSSITTKNTLKGLFETENYIAVIDALIYNHADLCSSYGISTDISDEELLLEIIYSKGYSSLKTINGDFCGVIFDKRNCNVTFFRDHLGIRPLYYYFSDNILVFCSDYRGILSIPEIDFKINPKWIYATVTGNVLSTQVSTEYQNVYCSTPASILSFSFSDEKIKKEEHLYWKINEKKVRFAADSEYICKLRELVTDAIKRRLDACPDLVGSELSGGLDSSVISILINRLGRDALYLSWSASPEDLPLVEKDERHIINDICNQENIICYYQKEHDFLDGTSDWERATLPLLFNSCPETDDFSRKDAFPPYLNGLPLGNTSQFMREHNAKIIFTGHTGDEGVSHRMIPYEMFHHKEFWHYFKYWWQTTNRGEHRARRFIKNLRNDISYGYKLVHNVYTTSIHNSEILVSEFANEMQNVKGNKNDFFFDPANYIMRGGSRNRFDVTAVYGACSHTRYVFPFADYRVIDFAVSIPRYMYLSYKSPRHIYRTAFKDIMPSSLYRGFSKETASTASIQNESKRYEKDIKKIINSFDKKLWDNYLNFDYIESLMDDSTPIDSEINEKKRFTFYILSTLSLAQNLIDKCRP